MYVKFQCLKPLDIDGKQSNTRGQIPQLLNIIVLPHRVPCDFHVVPHRDAVQRNIVTIVTQRLVTTAGTCFVPEHANQTIFVRLPVIQPGKGRPQARSSLSSTTSDGDGAALEITQGDGRLAGLALREARAREDSSKDKLHNGSQQRQASTNNGALALHDCQYPWDCDQDYLHLLAWRCL